MNCLRLNTTNNRLVLKKSPIPKVENDQEVVVKVALAGLCGTDLHIVEGSFKAVDGVVLGHEFVGIVHDAPKNGSFKVGDHVFVNPNITCNVCYYCRRGLYNFCLEGGLKYTVGISVDGGFAEYCKVLTSVVYKMPETVKFEQAVLCEPLSCITHALDVIGPIELGSRILVIGAGIIGLLLCSLLHFMGHRKIFVVQRSLARRKTFDNLNLGSKAVSWDELEECRKKSVDCCTFNVIIDTSGNVEAIEKSIPYLEKGGKLVIFGVTDPNKKISVSPFELYKKELTIVGTAINTNTSFQAAIGLLEAMGDTYFTPEKLNMNAYSLQEYESALKDLSDRKYTKILFKM